MEWCKLKPCWIICGRAQPSQGSFIDLWGNLIIISSKFIDLPHVHIQSCPQLDNIWLVKTNCICFMEQNIRLEQFKKAEYSGWSNYQNYLPQRVCSTECPDTGCLYIFYSILDSILLRFTMRRSIYAATYESKVFFCKLLLMKFSEV